MIKYKRLLKRAAALFLTLTTLASTPIISWANDPGAGGVNIGNGAAFPGNGTGGAYLVGLIEIENYAKKLSSDYMSDAYIQRYSDNSGNYIGDYRVSMLIANNGGKPNGLSTDWANWDFVDDAAYITRSDFGTTSGGYSSRVVGEAQIYLDDCTKFVVKKSPTNVMAGDPAFTTWVVGDTHNNIPGDNWTGEDAGTYAHFASMMERNDCQTPGHSHNWKAQTEEEFKKIADCMLENILVNDENGSEAAGLTGLARDANNVAGNMFALLKSGNQVRFINTIKSYQVVSNDNAVRKVTGYSSAIFGGVARAQLKTNGVEADSPLGQKLRDLIAKFLKHGNADGSDSFLCIGVIPVAGQRDTNTSTPRMYSYIAALNQAFPGTYTLDRYNRYMREFMWDLDLNSLTSKYPTGELTSSIDASETAITNDLNAKFGKTPKIMLWMRHYFSPNELRFGGILSYGGSTTTYLEGNIEWENSLVTIDAKNNHLSNYGFALIGTMNDNNRPPGRPDCEHDCTHEQVEDGSINVSVDPNVKQNSTECSTETPVTITVELGMEDKAIDKNYTYFLSQKAAGKADKMKVEIVIDASTIKVGTSGEPNDANFFNVLANLSGYTVVSQTNNKIKLQSPEFTTKEQLRQYVSGPNNKIVLTDTDITVCDLVNNKYRASAVLCFGNTQSTDTRFNPKGKETEDIWAYDTSLIYVNEKPHFYSQMRHEPFSEIKADVPYEERYEAMGGVPTTENLYWGNGATEYLVNVDLEYKTESAKRIWTFKVNNSNCWADNTPCSGATSCPTHPQGGDPPPPPAKCSVTHSCMYGSFYSGAGCSYSTFKNQAHPGPCNYTYTITQPIETYAYMDIIAEQLHRLEYFKWYGNDELSDPSAITLDPDLGVYAFYDQKGYSSGNGRLQFSVRIDSNKVDTSAGAQLWGNTTSTQSFTINAVGSQCEKTATDAINKIIQALNNITVTAVSDYTVLETSEGYQSVMYYTYKSNPVSLSSLTVSGWSGSHGTAAGATGTFTASATAPAFTWQKVPTQEEMWDNNGLSSAKWDEDHITTTGYNGKFKKPFSKYNNSNSTRTSNPAKDQLDKGQPNKFEVVGDNGFYRESSSTYNDRYVYDSGIDIHDSTEMRVTSGSSEVHDYDIDLDGFHYSGSDYIKDRKWSASDSVRPVTNGEWDTGHVKVKYTHDIDFDTTRGDDNAFLKWDKERESTYSDNHDKVNNIVIHNPISNRDAVLISNDDKYDDRYWGKLDRPLATQPGEKKCPRNSGCQFSTLTCNEPVVNHTSACYKTINYYNCNKAPNVHEHSGNCYHQHNASCYQYEWQCNYVNCCHGAGSTAWSNSNTIDPVPCGGYHHNGSHLTGNQRLSCNKEGTLNDWSYETAQKHVIQCRHTNSSHWYSVDVWVPANANYCVCGHTGCRFSTLATDGQTKQEAYIEHPLEGKDYMGTDGKLYWVASELAGFDSQIFKFYKSHKYQIVRPDNGAAAWNGWYHVYDITANVCLSCKLAGSSHQTHLGCHTVVTDLDLTYWLCNKVLNKHVHTAACNSTMQVLNCVNPHHKEPGESVNRTDPKYHYPFADTRCYTPCKDDKRHNTPTTINTPDGPIQSHPTYNAFINVDRDFQIYYPDTGDFHQLDTLGLSEVSNSRCLGYVDGTDTNVWLRNKYVQFPAETIDSNGNYWLVNERIDLLKLPNAYTAAEKEEWNDGSATHYGKDYYTFTCTAVTDESASSIVTFKSVASNAPEYESFNDATDTQNLDRYDNYDAKMSVIKTQIIDVIGSIGSLNINDVGDPRFAELFKKATDGWLIQNVVHQVDSTKSNFTVSDNHDVRLEKTDGGYASDGTTVTSSSTDFHGTYGQTDMPTGAKNNPYKTLPLTPDKNPIKALQKEFMRPGYNLYMDVETLGRYYGNNIDWENSTDTVCSRFDRTDGANGQYEYFMQITPKYWVLDLETKQYKECDVYMKDDGDTYRPVYLTPNADGTTPNTIEYYNYLDWLNESERRNYATGEAQKTGAVVAKSMDYNPFYTRTVTNEIDVIGTPSRQYLIDLDRTFIGSKDRYGINMDHGNNLNGGKTDPYEDATWGKTSQRWHFTLGLPSSSVFVYKGTRPSDKTNFERDIKAIREGNKVIVTTINIKVHGDIWTLEYDGSALNAKPIKVPYGDNIIEVTPPGENPDDPSLPPKDPVIVIYPPDRTSADDMKTEGTH